MILRTAGGGNTRIQQRDMFSGVDVVPLPSQALGNWSVAGRRVTPDRGAGLPAMLRGIRFLAETVGTLPIVIYRGDPTNPDMQAVTLDVPQYDILQKRPNPLQTSFDFKAFIVASVIGYGNAYILKAKFRGKVLALYPIAPSRVTAKVGKDGFSLEYKVKVTPQGGETVDMTRSDLIHIPGVLFKDPFIGTSPLLMAANAVGGALAAEEYGARFYDNNAIPAGIIKFPLAQNSQAAKDTREVWEDRHRTPKNAHRVGVLFGGADYQQIGISATDAQVIEVQRWDVERIANILGLPSWALGGPDPNPRSTPEQRNTGLLQFSIAPWLVRLEQGFHADEDLFPDKELCPHFLAEGMLRADTEARYAAYTQARQAGWLSINDIRRKENMEPVEGGDVYQATPVGGAPNLQPGQENPDQTVEPAEPET